MPYAFVRRALLDRDGLALYDDNFISELAEKFGVSVQALMFRLQYLGYIEG
jgi:Zn-dependent peptidase ImmA (M78 family)